MSGSEVVRRRSMPVRDEKVKVPGPEGDLEGVLSIPEEDEGAHIAVICHPHPLHGGTLSNKVVHTAARACCDLGAPSLRFNFRGVGDSAGAWDGGDGETDDALAACRWLGERFPGRRLWLGGFSFGAYVAMRAAAGIRPESIVTIAPPVNHFDFSALSAPMASWLLVHGDEDEVVPWESVRHWLDGVTVQPRVRLLKEAGHFFHGRLAELRAILADFLQRAGRG